MTKRLYDYEVEFTATPPPSGLAQKTTDTVCVLISHRNGKTARAAAHRSLRRNGYTRIRFVSTTRMSTVTNLPIPSIKGAQPRPSLAMRLLGDVHTPDPAK